MSNVDLIVAYLSGDLETEKRKDFEERISKDAQLSAEYHEVSDAWLLVKEQIAARNEDSFRQLLKRIMKKHIPPGQKPLQG
ncbi:MAG: hypothetical protein CSA96_09975 [Bacteroidetes bacterium]|nr:MAG: hypothetical protein CSA96_09975 [Bacteroidota bacterium]